MFKTLSFKFFWGQGRRRGNNHAAISTLQLYASEKNGPEDVAFESYSLSDAGLIALGEGFPKLEKLSLIWCSNVSSAGLISLAKKCAFLRSLDLQVSFFCQLCLKL